MSYKDRIHRFQKGYKATPERASKSDYGGPRKHRYRVDTLANLERRGKIDGEAFTAAMKWIKDFVFANYAYADFLRQSLPKGVEKGDVHTFALSRGKAMARIDDAREAIGEDSHQLLVQAIYFNKSLSAIARRMYPSINRPNGIKKIQSKIIDTLEKLRDYNVAKHRRAMRKKRFH